jgi:hypothetical protein
MFLEQNTTDEARWSAVFAEGSPPRIGSHWSA